MDLSTARAKSLYLVRRNNFNWPTLKINYEQDIASKEKTTMTTLLSEHKTKCKINIARILTDYVL